MSWTRPVQSVRHGIRQLCAVAFLIAVLGCSSSDQPTQDPSAIVIGGVEKIDSALAANKGKWVLVNVWATWCKPCVEETPDLVKLQNELASNGYTTFAVSADNFTSPTIDAASAKVTQFVEQQNVNYPNILFAGRTDDMTDRLSLSGALPETIIFGPDGTEATRFIGMLQEPQLSRIRNLVK